MTSNALRVGIVRQVTADQLETAHWARKALTKDLDALLDSVDAMGTLEQIIRRLGACPIRLETRYNHGYTRYMKTAISIPDSLFEEADRLAKSRGWSRSELYANAVTAYVNSERFSGVREKLDAVYGNDEEDSAIDPFLADAQARSLPREKW